MRGFYGSYEGSVRVLPESYKGSVVIGEVLDEGGSISTGHWVHLWFWGSGALGVFILLSIRLARTVCF